MVERRRAWGWRMWSGGGEKRPPLRETSLLGGRYVHQDEKAIAEKAYPASYNVLLTRLATMVSSAACFWIVQLCDFQSMAPAGF
jgi:hypothetical protein